MNFVGFGALVWKLAVRLLNCWESRRCGIKQLTLMDYFCRCVSDGLATPIGTVGTYFAKPFDKKFGPNLINVLPGYFEQHPDFDDVKWCPYIQSVPDDVLSPQEKFIACKTRPRTLPKLLDLDLLDNVVEQITTHNYTKGPILQYFCTAMLHQPIAYPKEYDINASDVLPEYFQPGRVKPVPSNDDFRFSINQAVRYMDDLFGSTMQAVKDAGQWNNTIVYFTSDNGGPIYTAAAANNYPLRSSKFSPFEGTSRTFAIQLR
jgi:Sulfatase